MERSADWIDQARGNLAHAQSDLERGFFDWASFSAHQAAEMAVKAVFQAAGAQAWGHSVADLVAELGQSQPVPEGTYERALELDKAYIPTRYPDAHPSGSPRRRYSQAEAERLVGHAGRIVEICEDLLPDA